MLFDFNDPKKRKTLSAIIIIVLILAMVGTMVVAGFSAIGG